MEAEAARTCRGRNWWGLVGNRGAVPIPRSQAVSRGNCHQEGRPTLHSDSTKPRRADAASSVRPQGARRLTPEKEGRAGWGGGADPLGSLMCCCCAPLVFLVLPSLLLPHIPSVGPAPPGSTPAPACLAAPVSSRLPHAGPIQMVPLRGSTSADWQAHRPSPESSWPTSGLAVDEGQEGLGC